MFCNFLSGRLRSVCQVMVAGTLVAIFMSSAPVLAETALLNGSFEDDVVTTGNMLEQVPSDWRQTWGFADVIDIYRPGVGDAFYGQIPDGDQAVLYSANKSQELQPGAVGAEGTGIIMEEGVKITLLFDAVFFTEAEGGNGIQISALNTVDYNHQMFIPNSAADGFGTITYEYTPAAADASKNFSFWCYSTMATPEFLVDNFRYEVGDVPEPSTLMLLIGMVVMLIWWRKK